MSNAKHPRKLTTMPNGDRLDFSIDPADNQTWPPGHNPMIQLTLARLLDVEAAKKLTHDALLAAARPARRSGVTWTIHDAVAGRGLLRRLRLAGTVDRPDFEQSLADNPAWLLVVASCVVDSRVLKAQMN